MKTIQLSSGQSIPVLGLGTWRMGEAIAQRQQEIAALQQGLDLGMNLIDTAEMYGEGGAETVIAEVIAQRRESVFLVSKVYPHNASRRGAIAACERSLQRLKTDYLDLYLLHWRGSIPLSETLEAFQTLKQAGKIRDYGVSNFDVADMEEANTLPGGEAIATNQVLYNLQRRGIEWNLLPWCQQHQIPVMAYSPVEQGRLLQNRTLKAIAQEKGVTAAQVAIAWLLHQENVIVIPKASNVTHVKENRAALDLKLSPDDLQALDRAFPPPVKPVALEML
ncbi:aldo/keto reductase [Oscillatoria sp. FACHB-1407]|uniref:aldo/keto reductase n=1 Tax=Oscillatoria sp. FACHB-1407 TaxID=2692847 RepID=UPI001687E97D|nr:aldo/keto reductase [Oscillatoria sp. FACHB-1407]MBD2465787.1 aldo/keto reductase [Oscillatoria sp. FACHB-1407]